jgi:hypothetical protein
MKVGELKEGMLIVPTPDRGWFPMAPRTHPVHAPTWPEGMQYLRVNWLKNCRGRDPAVYLGRIKFEKRVHGLYTYHQVLYNGVIYLIDGYEFNGRIDPL